MIVQGQGSYKWHAGWRGTWRNFCNGSGQPPCFVVASGGPMVMTVTPLPADLQLSASSRRVTTSTSITFTGSVTPSTVKGIALPYQGVAWRFTPDSGSATTPCSTSLTCNYAPPSSGTMKLSAIVNGVQHSEEVYISVVPCLLGDTLLDDMRIRRRLKQAWDATGYPGPQSGRQEQTGARFGDGTDTTFVPPLGGADACVGWKPPTSPWTGPKGPPVVVWHTHPWKHGETRLPGLCPDFDPPDPKGANEGPSPKQDIDPYRTFGIPIIVVGPDNVFIVNWRWNGSKFVARPMRTFPRSVCNPTTL